MNEFFDKIQKYYRLKLYQERHLDKLVEAGAITEEEKQAILKAE